MDILKRKKKKEKKEKIYGVGLMALKGGREEPSLKKDFFSKNESITINKENSSDKSIFFFVNLTLFDEKKKKK